MELISGWVDGWMDKETQGSEGFLLLLFSRQKERIRAPIYWLTLQQLAMVSALVPKLGAGNSIQTPSVGGRSSVT